MTDHASLEERLAVLEAEVARLTAADDVKQLMNTYGYLLDKCYYDEIRDLFVPDSVACPTIHHDGAHYIGSDGVRRFYEFLKQHNAAGRNGPACGEFVDHPYMQHVVTVLEDGERALGRCRMLAQKARHEHQPGGPVQLWAAGIYENEYRRVDGRWRFVRLNLSVHWATSFDEGWALAANRPSTPPVLFPASPFGPDALVDHHAPVWPASTAAFPFHFGHPITGQPILDRLPAGQSRLPPLRRVHSPRGRRRAPSPSGVTHD